VSLSRLATTCLRRDSPLLPLPRGRIRPPGTSPLSRPSGIPLPPVRGRGRRLLCRPSASFPASFRRGRIIGRCPGSRRLLCRRGTGRLLRTGGSSRRRVRGGRRFLPGGGCLAGSRSRLWWWTPPRRRRWPPLSPGSRRSPMRWLGPRVRGRIGMSNRRPLLLKLNTKKRVVLSLRLTRKQFCVLR